MGSTDPTIAELQQTIDILEAENRQLREFNESFASLYEAMVEGVSIQELITDSDGAPVDYRIMDVNPAYEEMTGLKRDDTLGRLASSIYGTGDAPYLGIFAQVVKSGRPKSFETYFPPMEKHFSISVISPAPNFFATIFFDITARKKAETELARIFSMSLSLICIADVNTATFLKVNPAFTDVLGHPEAELLGKPFLAFIHPDDIDATEAVIENSLKKGLKVINFQNRYRCKDGTYRWLDWVSHPDPQQGITYAAAHDVTELKEAKEERERLQAQLSQAQKMEAVGTLAGGIAHDFNNLLMGIMGRTSLLGQDLEGAPDQLEHIQGIDACVKSAMNLTKQLLGIARGGKYEVRATDINRLIEDTLEMFSRTKKEISTTTAFTPDLSAVTVDRTQISQVLLNIFVNAWQAMPSGGDLRIHTENTTLDEEQAAAVQTAAGRYVRIAITDNGIGIPPEIRHRIFDPFFTTKEKGRGTGLGLASAYGIIKNHGGHITVTSEPGLGTTFNVYLPASSEAPSVDKAVDPNPIAGTGTVLIVDDEPEILVIGQMMLERLGYTVLTAASGQEALKRYEQHRDSVQVIILDMIMPKLSGGETFDALRAMDPACRVILSSGYSINGQASNILDRGCNGFIQKPFNLTQLSEKVHAVLSVG
ncbi:MAG: ATP-binding protein [Pseudomonadota bacterium]